MKSCVAKNSKTILSVDFTTDCPKRRAGNPCKYCYVESARNMGFNAKVVCDYVKYNGEVKRFSKEKIDLLNSVGGLRLFSFGDYMPEHDKDIKNLLNDALEMGLKVKAITKQVKFIMKYAKHPAISVINLSIDNVNCGVNWVTAKVLRMNYSKVKIRCVIMKDEDIVKLSFSDVFTFNHARGLSQYGYALYSKTKVKEYFKMLNGKVCCSTGRCVTCSLKCAVA